LVDVFMVSTISESDRLDDSRLTSEPEPEGTQVGAKLPFEKVVEEHGATVLRVCRAVLGSDETQDAWSETFLAAMRAWPELPADANVQAWLVTIAHRKAVDVVRARRRGPVPVAHPLETPSRDGVPGQHLELWAALAELPLKQRYAVAYHHLAGLPHAEVARILGGSPAAARKAASDGIQRLRAIVFTKDG
jgi:RNA polymerase sigma factor (sigma-70 family)